MYFAMSIKKGLVFLCIIALVVLEGWLVLFMPDTAIFIINLKNNYARLIIIRGWTPKIIGCIVSWLLAYAITLELTGDVLRHESD